MERIAAQLSALLALTVFTQAASAQNPGSVSGHVYSADVNQPCRFAVVNLRSANVGGSGGGGGSFSATTDLEGAFVVPGVPSGTYTVTAQMPGYLSVPVAGGAAASAAPDTTQGSARQQTIVVEDNQQTPVELRLERGASLSGSVRFDDGSPASNLEVRLLQLQSGSWKPYSTAGSGFSGRTDDRGSFRQAGLAPGTYAVDVSVPAIAAPSLVSGRRVFTPRSSGQALHVYTGDTFRLHDVKGLEVHTGDERTGADVQIALAGLHSVRGVIGVRSSGRRVSQGSVRLLDPADKSVIREATIVEGGLFSFSYVPAGSYLIHIEGRPDRRDSQSGSYQPLEQSLTVDGDLVNLAFDLLDSQ